MELRVVGSSSSGNCYLLYSKIYNETLVVEAGCEPSEVRAALDYKVGSIVGCVVSHQHKDHAKYVKDMVKSGIHVLGLKDVFCEEMCYTRYTSVIEPKKTYSFGNFDVLPIPVKHDVPCVAYLIKHPDMGKLLFVTDTISFDYKIPSGVNHLLLEANYSNRILEQNIDNGLIAPAMSKRIRRAHMDIETTANIIRTNELPNLQNVVLIHLSDNNSDEEEFKRYIKGICGVPTYVANKDMTIDLNNEYDG